MKRLGIVSGLAFWLLITAAPNGSAGGSVWHFDDQEYKPGDIAEATTSVAWSQDGSLGRPEDGPFVIYLAPLEAVAEPWLGLPDGSIPVGIVEIHVGPYQEADGEWYGPHHAVARFEIPDVSPGEYQIAHCNSPCTKTLGDIVGGWDLHVIAGPNGRPASEIADEVWLAVEEYPQWTEPETTAPGEEATDPELDMPYPPSRAVSSVEPPIEPVTAPDSTPDSTQVVASPESVDPDSSSWAIGFLVTALAAVLVLLLAALVDRIGWSTKRFVRNRRRTDEVEVIASKETLVGAVQKDEVIAPRTPDQAGDPRLTHQTSPE
jgi:hypothetical protein